MSVVKMKDSGDIKVLISAKIDEGLGSIAYNRSYKMYDYEKLIALSKNGPVTEDNLRKAQNSDLVIHGETSLPFEDYDAVPPIRIVPTTTYQIKVATPKQPEHPEWEF